MIREEEKPTFFGPGPAHVADYKSGDSAVGMDEHEAFSPGQRVDAARGFIGQKHLRLARPTELKNTGATFTRLDQVPDEELDEIAGYGITGLWLIGLWQRSKASQNSQADDRQSRCSGLGLFAVSPTMSLGKSAGNPPWTTCAQRAGQRGIRMASDMVPNHMAIDSRWVIEHPDWFLSLPHQPFPNGNFETPDLCDEEGVGIYLEAGYYSIKPMLR